MSQDDERYRRLVENPDQPYFFYAHGIDGAVSFVTPAVTRILGYTPAEFMARHATLFSDSPLNREAARHTGLSIQGVRQPPYLVEFLHQDGGRRTLEVIEVPVFGPDASVCAVEGIAHDVSERQLAEARRAELLERLERLNHEMAELDRERNVILGVVAHDLRTPLTSIQGWAEALRQVLPAAGAPWAAEKRRTFDDGLARIVERAKAMASLVGRLLGASALEAGRLSLDSASVDLWPILQQVAEDHRPSATRKGVDVLVQRAGECPLVQGDPNGLREVVDNLVSNAIKFSPRGRPVSVQLATAEAGARLSVRDQGPGVKPEERERLFVRFARLSARPTAGEDSIGLGLSIVRKLVQAMGGRVWYEDAAGGGSCFCVELRGAIPPRRALR